MFLFLGDKQYIGMYYTVYWYVLHCILGTLSELIKDTQLFKQIKRQNVLKRAVDESRLF